MSTGNGLEELNLLTIRRCLATRPTQPRSGKGIRKGLQKDQTTCCCPGLPKTRSGILAGELRAQKPTIRADIKTYTVSRHCCLGGQGLAAMVYGILHLGVRPDDASGGKVQLARHAFVGCFMS
jgi:hypothetical protein